MTITLPDAVAFVMLGALILYALTGGADFGGANLSNARFRRADLEGTSFRNADLEGADFSQARLIGADFSGCSLFGASFFASDQTPYAQLDASTRFDAPSLQQLTPEQRTFLEDRGNKCQH